MRIPLTPPDFKKILTSLTPKQMSAFLTDENLQQDETLLALGRFSTSGASSPWSVEHWWTRIKLGRLWQMKPLPLPLDKQCKPFAITTCKRWRK